MSHRCHFGFEAPAPAPLFSSQSQEHDPANAAAFTFPTLGGWKRFFAISSLSSLAGELSMLLQRLNATALRDSARASQKAATRSARTTPATGRCNSAERR
jgi:hypothetical protein